MKSSGSNNISAIETAPLDPERLSSQKSFVLTLLPSMRKRGLRIKIARNLEKKRIRTLITIVERVINSNDVWAKKLAPRKRKEFDLLNILDTPRYFFA